MEQYMNIWQIWISNQYGRMLAIVRTYDPDYWMELAQAKGYGYRAECLEMVELDSNIEGT